MSLSWATVGEDLVSTDGEFRIVISSLGCVAVNQRTEEMSSLVDTVGDAEEWCKNHQSLKSAAYVDGGGV